MGPGSRGQQLKGRGGFSLLEAILGAFLVSIAFGGFAAAWILQEQAMKKYRNHNFVHFLAQQEMETALAQGFSGVTWYAASNPRTLEVIREIDHQSSTQTFDVAVTILNETDLSKDIKVTVDNDQDNLPPFSVESTLFFTS